MQKIDASKDLKETWKALDRPLTIIIQKLYYILYTCITLIMLFYRVQKTTKKQLSKRLKSPQPPW